MFSIPEILGVLVCYVLIMGWVLTYGWAQDTRLPMIVPPSFAWLFLVVVGLATLSITTIKLAPVMYTYTKLDHRYSTLLMKTSSSVNGAVIQRRSEMERYLKKARAGIEAKDSPSRIMIVLVLARCACEDAYIHHKK